MRQFERSERTKDTAVAFMSDSEFEKKKNQIVRHSGKPWQIYGARDWPDGSVRIYLRLV